MVNSVLTLEESCILGEYDDAIIVVWCYIVNDTVT